MNVLNTSAARAFANNYMTTTPDAVQAAKQGTGPANGVMNNDVMLVRSSDSAFMLEYWDLSDTLVDGINAMRLAGEAYLPKFTDEQDKDYRFRLNCTKMTNVYRDTVEGLASKPFEEEIEIVADENKTVPDDILAFAENVDGSGNNLTMFSAATFFNGINSAIDWIFVDFPKANPNVRTQADAKDAGLRPYWSHVLGRNVLEPRSKVINGRETLTYLRIFEPGKPDNIRVFTRNDDGSVVWELFEKRNDWRDVDGGRTQFYPIADGSISIGKIPLVPFYTGRRDGRSWKFFPAMRDAADLQRELYLQESGLKFAKQLTAYPMLAGNGVKPPLAADGKTPLKLAVGPARVLYAPPDPSGAVGSWAFVEPAATSLKFLADDVKDTIEQLRELGRQPLMVSNVTVIAANRSANKSKSAVKSWAFGLKDALENALVMTCAWMNISTDNYDPTVNVYTEFDEFMDGKDLDSLDADRDRGDISRETLWEEKKRRGVYSAEFTAERERQRLLDELPGDGEDTGNPDE